MNEHLELEHLPLERLIPELEKRPEGRYVPLGFCEPHSYRGYYRLAFAPNENTTVGAMRDAAPIARKDKRGK